MKKKKKYFKKILKLLNEQKKVNRILMDTNKKLEEAVKQAECSSQSKSVFVSHMSHDIRTPLSGIIGMTDIAIKNINNQERVLDCLKKIDGSSRHLLSLVNDVLDMSRIESGKTTVNYEKMNMSRIIEDCSLVIDGLLVSRNVELVKEFDFFSHPMLIGDELHLRQVLINILGNAVKFTPDGGKIYFRVKEASHAHGRAVYRFEIEDTGIGMTPSFLETIWEPFTQENGGFRIGQRGTGLGMAITRKFVDLMGGTITVESEAGVGSCFCAVIGFDIDSSAGETDDIKEEKPICLNGMNVLLVEDVELNMEIAQVLLEEAGIKVTGAGNGQLAVDIFKQYPEGTFDAILMDIRMPVMDGLAATKTIRTLPRADAADIPIIAMTAAVYEEDIRKALDAGMNAYLAKPINQEELFRTLSRYS